MPAGTSTWRSPSRACSSFPAGATPLLRLADVDVAGTRIKTLIAGDGPIDVVCLHGLGANKTSFFETVAALAGDCTVHAIDLPGFGSSAKPLRARYNAPWFADAVLGYLDATGIDAGHLIGNSMGGRIAIEVAFRAPERVESLSLLAPSMAWRRRRELVPLVRLLRPELASIPHPLRAATVRAQFWSMFARPERLDPVVADVAAEEFLRNYRLARRPRGLLRRAAQHLSRRAPRRRRLLVAARRPRPAGAVRLGGRGIGWCRQSSPGTSRRRCPQASQIVLEECGHVPQVELPERTGRLIREHVFEAARAAEPRRLPSRGLLSARSAPRRLDE